MPRMFNVPLKGGTNQQLKKTRVTDSCITLKVELSKKKKTCYQNDCQPVCSSKLFSQLTTRRHNLKSIPYT